MAALQSHDYAEARKMAKALYQAAPDIPDTLRLLGLVAEQEKHPAEALLYYEKVLKKNPDDLTLMSTMAHLYGDAGKNDQAAAFFMELIKKDPTNPENKYELALIDKKIEKNAEAKDLLERSMKEAETGKNELLKKKIEAALKGL